MKNCRNKNHNRGTTSVAVQTHPQKHKSLFQEEGESEAGYVINPENFPQGLPIGLSNSDWKTLQGLTFAGCV